MELGDSTNTERPYHNFLSFFRYFRISIRPHFVDPGLVGGGNEQGATAHVPTEERQTRVLVDHLFRYRLN